MTNLRRIYLDNAATTFPKPESVYAAVDHYNRNLGAAVGRGAYREANETQDLVEQARHRVAQLLGAEGPSRIVWTFNGTDSLNLAIKGVLRPGDHAITSVVEHNSVLRPLRELEVDGQIEVIRVGCDDRGRVDPVDFRKALRPNTRLIVLVHASNVTGTVQPVEEVGRIAREAGALFLVDAAQSAGHLPIDLAGLPCDLLACPGHKGLLGPLGTGVLYVRPGVEDQVRSLKQGGTGSLSEDDRHPTFLPDKFEPGNHNAPAIIGLGAGVEYLLEHGVASLHRREQELSARLLAGLADIPHVRIYGPPSGEGRLGVVSITVAGYEPQELAGILDDHYRIQVRAGLHCAPLAHRALGTLETGGTIRFSLGPFNASEDVDAVLTAVQEIADASFDEMTNDEARMFKEARSTNL